MTIETKRERGRPSGGVGTGVPIQIRTHQPLLSAIELWSAQKGVSRNEAFRQLAVIGLSAERRLKA
jgi:hypothetical protein